MIISIVLYTLFLWAFVFFPLPVQIICFGINAFVSDPIPVLDEVIMVIATLKKMNSYGKILSFVMEHKLMSVIIAILGLLIIFNI